MHFMRNKAFHPERGVEQFLEDRGQIVGSCAGRGRSMRIVVGREAIGGASFRRLVLAGCVFAGRNRVEWVVGSGEVVEGRGFRGRNVAGLELGYLAIDSQESGQY